MFHTLVVWKQSKVGELQFCVFGAEEIGACDPLLFWDPIGGIRSGAGWSWTGLAGYTAGLVAKKYDLWTLSRNVQALPCCCGVLKVVSEPAVEENAPKADAKKDPKPAPGHIGPLTNLLAPRKRGGSWPGRGGTFY